MIIITTDPTTCGQSFELCLRAEASGDGSKVMLMAEFTRGKPGKMGTNCGFRRELWRPTRKPHEGPKPPKDATAEPEPDKLIDLVMNRFGPQRTGMRAVAPELHEIWEAGEAERMAVLTRHCQRWLDEATLWVTENKRLNVGTVNAVYGTFAGEVQLEPITFTSRWVVERAAPKPPVTESEDMVQVPGGGTMPPSAPAD